LQEIPGKPKMAKIRGKSGYLWLLFWVFLACGVAGSRDETCAATVWEWAWDYGFSAGLFFAMLFHLPVILVLWPKIIWRKNWLFGVVPAVVLVLGAFVLFMTGTTEQTGVDD
jgi:hypothetical protein